VLCVAESRLDVYYHGLPTERLVSSLYSGSINVSVVKLAIIGPR
jgi:hypothetical protein